MKRCIHNEEVHPWQSLGISINGNMMNEKGKRHVETEKAREATGKRAGKAESRRADRGKEDSS